MSSSIRKVYGRSLQKRLQLFDNEYFNCIVYLIFAGYALCFANFFGCQASHYYSVLYRSLKLKAIQDGLNV